MQEFNDFKQDLSDRVVQVGLTLRYAMITKLVVDKLKEYGPQLGKLKKVESWEHVNFGHGLSIIMMNWRRYASLSGGLLIEKSIHDLDLALYYMEAAGIQPNSFTVSTRASHDFYKKSNSEKIKDRLLQDVVLRKSAERWDRVPWQRVIPFCYNENEKIDWNRTIDGFFQEFPEDEELAISDIIPDNQQLYAKITTPSGDEVDFSLDVRLNGFANSTDRGSKLLFENGEAEVDLEGSQLTIRQQSKEPVVFDLNTRGIPHSGGDVYVAHTLLGTLPEGKLSAEFSNPSVQISTIMSLISEEQARSGDQTSRQVSKINGQWVVEP